MSTSREVSSGLFSKKYSVCALATDLAEYEQMKISFVKAGFTEDICEYLYIDNSRENRFDAYSGINKFLRAATGEYIILCHQDILLNYDNLKDLEARIKEMDIQDPSWAILSNAGGIDIRNVVYKITYPDGVTQTKGKIPAKVKSVDENFILVKNSANLVLSADLKGFHLYGTDLCLIAGVLGYSAYVIDFNLLHKSKGTIGKDFKKSEKQLIEKYSRAFKSRYIESTCTRFYISGGKVKTSFFNSRLMISVAKFFYGIKKHIK